MSTWDEWTAKLEQKIRAGQYDTKCFECQTDSHVCKGCGTPLNHDGTEIDGTKHNAQRPHCYE